jgi:hypothetical protein
VSAEGFESSEAVYKCRKKHGSATGESTLRDFLQQELGLRCKSIRQVKGRGAQFRVCFHSPADAYAAVRMGKETCGGRRCPYTKPPEMARGKVLPGTRAYEREQNLILAQDSICVPVTAPPQILVAASVLWVQGKDADEGKSFAMFSKLTAVPTQLLPALLAVRSTAELTTDGQVSIVLEGYL